MMFLFMEWDSNQKMICYLPNNHVFAALLINSTESTAGPMLLTLFSPGAGHISTFSPHEHYFIGRKLQAQFHIAFCVR